MRITSKRQIANELQTEVVGFYFLAVIAGIYPQPLVACLEVHGCIVQSYFCVCVSQSFRYNAMYGLRNKTTKPIVQRLEKGVLKLVNIGLIHMDVEWVGTQYGRSLQLRWIH